MMKDEQFRARLNRMREGLTIINNEINELYNDWKDSQGQNTSSLIRGKSKMGIFEYTKKPVRVKAIQFTGNNREEIEEWMGQSLLHGLLEGEKEYLSLSLLPQGKELTFVYPGDYVVQDEDKEFHAVKEKDFKRKYVINAIE